MRSLASPRAPRVAARVGLCASVCERARPLRPPSRALERDVISHHLGERPRAPQRGFAGQHRLHPPARRYGHCHRRAARRVRCCPFAALVPRRTAHPFLCRQHSPLTLVAARLQSERRGRVRVCRQPITLSLRHSRLGVLSHTTSQALLSLLPSRGSLHRPLPTRTHTPTALSHGAPSPLQRATSGAAFAAASIAKHAAATLRCASRASQVPLVNEGA